MPSAFLGHKKAKAFFVFWNLKNCSAFFSPRNPEGFLWLEKHALKCGALDPCFSIIKSRCTRGDGWRGLPTQIFMEMVHHQGLQGSVDVAELSYDGPVKYAF